MGPGDQERERVPSDANFPIISRAVYYFSVTNNLEFNTIADGIIVNIRILREEKRDVGESCRMRASFKLFHYIFHLICILICTQMNIGNYSFSDISDISDIFLLYLCI